MLKIALLLIAFGLFMYWLTFGPVLLVSGVFGVVLWNITLAIASISTIVGLIIAYDVIR